MDYCIENADHISAIASDSNEDLTAIGAGLLLSNSSQDGEKLASSVKMHILLAFYLGYKVGRNEGDLSVWESSLT